jgi:hypothetical protein
VKSLLNITVFAASVLSIFSTSLTLYEVPILKESLSAMEKEKEAQVRDGEKDLVRIYISRDVSIESKEDHAPLFTAKKEVNNSEPQENHLNVFGVQVPIKNARSNI